MTSPAHEVETSYEPHRDLITGVVNRSTVNREPSTVVPPDPAPAADPGQRTNDNGRRTISSYSYANDLLGRRETISQGGDAFGMLKLGQNKVEVAYNDRSEVTGAVYRTGGEARQTFNYDYDAIGNRERTFSEIDNKRSELSYETNSLNQYKKISANQRELAVPYDLDGNLLEDTRNTYTWNADNNLIRVDAKDGSLRLDYVYDHQSRRTVRIETKHPGTENEAQKTTYYLYDDWNLLAELEETKNEEPGTKHFVQRTFTWGRDLSGSLQGAGGVGGLLAITEGSATTSPERSTKNEEQGTNGETRFALYDANGNIGQLIDADANVVAAYAYDPFGNVTEMAGAEAAGNPWRFSTKPVEEGTGWLYYGFRYYQPETGRWLSRDPIGEQGGVNLYGTVQNDPVNFTDFLGLEGQSPGLTIEVVEDVSRGVSAGSFVLGIEWYLDGQARLDYSRLRSDLLQKGLTNEEADRVVRDLRDRFSARSDLGKEIVANEKRRRQQAGMADRTDQRPASRRIDAMGRVMCRAGQGMVLVSVTFEVVNIVSTPADNRGEEVFRAGARAGGAYAGAKAGAFMCAWGGPWGVGICGFVGAVGGAIGADRLIDRIPDGPGITDAPDPRYPTPFQIFREFFR